VRHSYSAGGEAFALELLTFWLINLDDSNSRYTLRLSVRKAVDARAEQDVLPDPRG
jgi:hypothetical protein